MSESLSQHLTHLGYGVYDLNLGNGWVAEFTRDAHGFKFWTLRCGSERLVGDAVDGQRVSESVVTKLTAALGSFQAREES